MDNRQTSIDSRQSLCDIRQSPINTRQSPLNNRQTQIQSEQSPMESQDVAIESIMGTKVNMDDIDNMEEEGEYQEHDLDSQQQIEMDHGTVVRQEEQSMYSKDAVTTQQESLISQLMHTNHLVSPSI